MRTLQRFESGSGAIAAGSAQFASHTLHRMFQSTTFRNARRTLALTLLTLPALPWINGCSQARPRAAEAQRAAVAGSHDIRSVESDWEAAFTRADGWTGADGLGTVRLPGDRVLWLFGDSWIGPVRDGKHAEGSAMVNNAIAVHPIDANAAAPAAIEFAWGPSDRDGRPTAWVIPPAEERVHDKNLRYWPAGGGVVVQDPRGKPTLFVFLFRIRDRGTDDVWNFEGCGSAVVRISNPQDPLSRWQVQQTTLTRLPAPLAPGTRIVAWGAAALAMAADAAQQNFAYIYGVDTTDGLNKKLLLARAPGDGLDRFESWTFRTGTGWSSDPADAAAIADQVMDEFSISRIETPAGPRYLMIYSKPILDDHIVARIASAPEGPWSHAKEIYRCPEPAQDKRLMVYSAKAHPELSADGTLLITYCVNSNDFWHMAANAWIYRPRFICMPLEQVLP